MGIFLPVILYLRWCEVRSNLSDIIIRRTAAVIFALAWIVASLKDARVA